MTQKFWQTKEWKKNREEILKTYDKCMICGSKKIPLVIHHPQEKNTLIDDFYVSLKDTQVLCKGCHWRLHNGFKRCPKCKNHWVKECYDVCWDCLPEDIRKEREETRLLNLEDELDERTMERFYNPKFKNEKKFDLRWGEDVIGPVGEGLITEWIKLKGKPDEITLVD